MKNDAMAAATIATRPGATDEALFPGGRTSSVDSELEVSVLEEVLVLVEEELVLVEEVLALVEVLVE